MCAPGHRLCHTSRRSTTGLARVRTRHRRCVRLLVCSAAGQSLLPRGPGSAIVRRGVTQGRSRQRPGLAGSAAPKRVCRGPVCDCVRVRRRGASAPAMAARASLCSVMRLAAVPGQGSRCGVTARPAARTRSLELPHSGDAPDRQRALRTWRGVWLRSSCGLALLVFGLKALARAARSMPICDSSGARTSLPLTTSHHY